MNKYKSIIIKRGSKRLGWSVNNCSNQVKNKILVVTTDGFPPLAKYIANLTGCELIDGFKIMVPEEEVVLAIIDCGGIARCGIYPKMVYQL